MIVFCAGVFLGAMSGKAAEGSILGGDPCNLKGFSLAAVFGSDFSPACNERAARPVSVPFRPGVPR
jgi:hypothetical protein